MPDITAKDVAQTKAAVPDADNKRISKIHVAKTDDDHWTAEIEYKDLEGNTTTGETQTFDEFSQASSWVADIAVETKPENGMQQPSVDHTEDL